MHLAGLERGKHRYQIWQISELDCIEVPNTDIVNFLWSKFHYMAGDEHDKQRCACPSSQVGSIIDLVALRGH